MQRSMSSSVVQTRIQRGTALQSLGSDLLERPDDEDSPEFKEYLRKLLQMQATRAKGGFASPSSASADAYIAKLNRIKLEKAALREAGLPEDMVDITYKPEDYSMAKAEGAEVAVSATVAQGGGSSGGGGKVSRTSYCGALMLKSFNVFLQTPPFLHFCMSSSEPSVPMRLAPQSLLKMP